MGRLTLWHFIVWLRLNRMDCGYMLITVYALKGWFHTEIWELDRVLYKENRNVVANDIPVPFIGVEFDGESSHITYRVGTSFATLDGGKPQKHRGVP